MIAASATDNDRRMAIPPRSTVATDIPAGSAWLTLRRTASDDMQERELWASLDGRRIAILLYGDEATFAVAPGRHELLVHNTISRQKAEFEAAPGQHVRFDAANLRGKGFVYWALFLGAAMMRTRLDRGPDGTGPTGPIFTAFRVESA